MAGYSIENIANTRGSGCALTAYDDLTSHKKIRLQPGRDVSNGYTRFQHSRQSGDVYVGSRHLLDSTVYEPHIGQRLSYTSKVHIVYRSGDIIEHHGEYCASPLNRSFWE